MTTVHGNSTSSGCGIYIIKCVPTGKVYVGSAMLIRKRWNDHREALGKGKHHSRLLQRAWLKYGESAFEFAVIQHCHPGDLIRLEQEHIDLHQSYDPARGFNINRTAGSRLGMTLGPEARAKLRAANLGKTHGPEVRAKMSEAKRGKVRSAEHCANLSKALKGIRRSPEHCRRMSEIKAELCGPVEYRRKMSEAAGGFTDEQLARIREMIARGGKTGVIAKEFGCSPQLICDIKMGRRYAAR